jgi:hypothetical protein
MDVSRKHFTKIEPDKIRSRANEHVLARALVSARHIPGRLEAGR